jgi:tetratricopeptide (TPR) repeat protein
MFSSVDSLLATLDPAERAGVEDLSTIEGLVALHRLEFIEAERAALRAAAVSTRPEAFIYLIELYLRQGRFEEAVRYARRATSVHPEEPMLMTYLITTLRAAGNDAAADSAQVSLQRFASPATRRFVLTGYSWANPFGVGWMQLARGDVTGARKVAAQARALDPDGRDWTVALFEGWCELVAGSPAAARPHFERATAVARPVSRESAEAKHALALCSLAAGDAVSAEREMRKLFLSGPLHVRYHRLLAEILAEEGKLDEAVRVARDAYRRDESGESAASLAAVLFAAGAVDEARSVASRSIELEPVVSCDPSRRVPGRSPAELTLARIAIRDGRLAEAVTNLEEAARKYPNHAAIEAALKEARGRRSSTLG